MERGITRVAVKVYFNGWSLSLGVGLDRVSRDRAVFKRRGHVGGSTVLAHGHQWIAPPLTVPSVSLSPV